MGMNESVARIGMDVHRTFSVGPPCPTLFEPNEILAGHPPRRAGSGPALHFCGGVIGNRGTARAAAAEHYLPVSSVTNGLMSPNDHRPYVPSWLMSPLSGSQPGNSACQAPWFDR